MPVKELERINDHEIIPDKKSGRPEQWQVVMHYQSPNDILCCSCLLKDIFGMSAAKADSHVKTAREKGRDSVFVSSRDVAETKAAEAKHSAEKRALYCTRAMLLVKFSAMPA